MLALKVPAGATAAADPAFFLQIFVEVHKISDAKVDIKEPEWNSISNREVKIELESGKDHSM